MRRCWCCEYAGFYVGRRVGAFTEERVGLGEGGEEEGEEEEGWIRD